jgi:hypothetical protein
VPDVLPQGGRGEAAGAPLQQPGVDRDAEERAPLPVVGEDGVASRVQLFGLEVETPGDEGELVRLDRMVHEGEQRRAGLREHAPDRPLAQDGGALQDQTAQ